MNIAHTLQKKWTMMKVDDIISTLEWMVTDMTHRHDSCGNPGNYSPDLSKAIDLLTQLRTCGGGVVLNSSDVCDLRILVDRLSVTRNYVVIQRLMKKMRA